MILKRSCDKCEVSIYCPKKGSSPQTVGKGTPIYCEIYGGFSKKPVPVEKLSDNSKAISEKNGRCFSIANVPVVIDGIVSFELCKIFHPPIFHKREKSGLILNYNDPRYK
jgi:hypothetical protein